MQCCFFLFFEKNIDINDCDYHMCVNGICIDGIADYTCNCNVGFTGTYCNESKCDLIINIFSVIFYLYSI